MKNENKVTIKQKKIMIHKFSRYLLTLVALFAMTTGAWAEGTVYNSSVGEYRDDRIYERIGA